MTLRCLRGPTLLAWVAAAGCTARPGRVRPPTKASVPTDGAEVHERVVAAYASCATYRDEGTAVLEITAQRGEFDKPVVFATAFSRPDRFKFEFSYPIGPVDEEPRARHVIWSDGARARSWSDLAEDVETGDLESLLGSVTGVSSGTASVVPPFLLGLAHERFTGPRLVGNETVHGVPCYRLEYEPSAAEPEAPVVWIDQASFLIRKTVEVMATDEMRAVTTRTYRPEVDAPLSDDFFRFEPPPVGSFALGAAADGEGPSPSSPATPASSGRAPGPGAHIPARVR